MHTDLHTVSDIKLNLRTFHCRWKCTVQISIMRHMWGLLSYYFEIWRSWQTQYKLAEWI